MAKVMKTKTTISKINAVGQNGKALNLKQIMVPIDFSGCCQKALAYAAAFAHDYKARITLVHIVDGPLDSDVAQKRENDLRTLAEAEIPIGIPVEFTVKCGRPLLEIVNMAKAGFVDMLVISTHARGRLPDFFMSSAAEEIVRYAPCPIIVIREDEHDFLTRTPARDP